jgi:type I restriction enzyme S subunit
MSGLPRSWATATVNDTGDYINGMAFKPDDWVEQGLPIIRIQNLTDLERSFNRTNRKVDPRYLVENGDILVSWSATLDAFVWDRGPAVLNQHIFKVVPETRLVYSGFLFHGLRESIREMIAGEHLHGSTMKHINRGPFLAHPFPVPPLPEQRRITAKIDSLSAKSRRACNHIDHIPRLVEKYKQAILATAFRERLSWKQGEVEQYIKDAQIGLVRGKGEQSVDRGVPYIRMNHFDLDGVWNIDDLTYVAATSEEAGRYNLVPGDILFNTRNSYELVGKVALWPDKRSSCVYNNNLLRLRFDARVSPEFALCWMKSPPFRDYLQGVKSATTSVCAIYQRSIMAAPIYVPDLQEQQKITHQIGTAFAWIDRVASEATNARKLIDHLDQAVLAKAFRGELVPQDPNDEPASVLLERIRAVRDASTSTKRVNGHQKGPVPRGRKARKA